MTRNSLVQEFVVSRDLEELLRCLKDINKPFYHHELVKSAIVHVLEEEQATKVNPAFLFNDTYSLSLNIYIYILNRMRVPESCFGFGNRRTF